MEKNYQISKRLRVNVSVKNDQELIIKTQVKGLLFWSSVKTSIVNVDGVTSEGLQKIVQRAAKEYLGKEYMKKQNQVL